MKDIQELHAATGLLDAIGAQKTQIVFISREEYEKTWGEVLEVGSAQGLVFEYIEQSKIPIIASVCIDAYDFIFIDPANLIGLKFSKNTL